VLEARVTHSDKAAIHVLLVEDDPEDADLFTRQLYQLGPYACTVDHCPTVGEAKAAFTTTQYDILFVDYRLGAESGLDFLAHRANGHSTVGAGLNAYTPAILVTGTTVDHDQEATGAGAVDYLVKGQITASVLERTLRHALDRSRRETDLRSARRDAETARVDMTTLIEQAVTGIFLSAADGRLLLVNEAGCQMMGYQREELLRLSNEDLVDPADLARQPIPARDPAGTIRRVFVRQLRRRDGSVFSAESSRSVLPDGRSIAIVRDLTESARAEAEVRFQALLLGAVQQVVVATDVRGAITYWNRSAEEHLGWSGT
jgi:PAS domain S-box-containing protein